MLQQVQKELIKNKTFKFATQVEEDFEKYLKLKREYEQLPALAKQKLSDQLKVFLLLQSYNKDDFGFAANLIDVHDYNKFDEPMIKMVLGRFYSRLKNCHKQTIDYLLPLFEKKVLEESDVEVLFKALSKMGMHHNCQRVLSFAVENYPNVLEWKIEALKHQIKMALIKESENKDVIIGNLNYLAKRCETSKQYALLAPCFYQVGQFDEYVEFYNLALETVTVDAEEKLKPFFDTSLCRETMDELIDILETEKIKPFPIAGSLLGLHRDGKFMDHDKDADIGIFISNYDEIFFMVSKICKETKFTAPAMVTSSKDIQKWNVAVYDTERFTAVDLFFFYRQPTRIEYGVYTICGTLKWTFKPFELTRQALVGREYWLPENIEEHLVEMYGESWREPIEAWDSLLNCPNLTSDSQPVAIYYGLMRLHNALHDGKTKKALNYYQQLTSRWGMKFSLEADANIKKILNLT